MQIGFLSEYSWFYRELPASHVLSSINIFKNTAFSRKHCWTHICKEIARNAENTDIRGIYDESAGNTSFVCNWSECTENGKYRRNLLKCVGWAGIDRKMTKCIICMQLCGSAGK